jgi:hypothetical protein
VGINFNDPRYIGRYTADEGACLFDTVTGTFVLDAEGRKIRVDRQTGKPLGEITKCAACGAVRRVSR